MDEFEKLLERLKEELGEDQITTASDPKIKRPERALERQAIDDFMDRNPMAGGGMLVQPSADGSRPGYSGLGENIYLNKDGTAYNVVVQAKNKSVRKSFNFAGIPRYKEYKNKTEALNAAKKFRDEQKEGQVKKFFQDEKKLKVANQYANLLNKLNPKDKNYVSANKYLDLTDKMEKQKIIQIMKANDFKFTKNYSKQQRFPANKEKLLMEAFNLTEDDFIKHGKYGIPLRVGPAGTKENPIFSPMRNFIARGFKFKKPKKSEILTLDQQEFVKNNFDLPEGKEWNFKSLKNPNGFKYGVAAAPGSGTRALHKRIARRLTDKNLSYTVAADRATPEGWMMNAMNRVYENEIKNKVKFENLTYQPVKNKKGIIIGFTDNTAAGGNKTYYGIKKNRPEDATAWTAHGDFNRIDKFLKIAKGAQVDEPGKLLQKILDDKGITKLLGDQGVITLNDVLSHERYFNKLSETSPRALIERQIVLHHTGGVGSGSNLARAAATKDLQLLKSVVNAKIQNLEKIVQGTSIQPGRKLTQSEIAQLKNYGAKITDFDGKVVGGGFLDPERQFKTIEKGAIDYAKSDQFNVKTVASYLERLGCGKAAGGRVFYNDGAFGLTKCAEKGRLKLENIVTKGAAPGSDDAVLAKQILRLGGGLKSALSLRGLFGPAAIAATVAFEGGLIGYDMLTSGKTLREAFGDNLLNYALGKDYQIDPQEELFKRFKGLGYDDQQIGSIKKALDAMNTINTGTQLAMDVGQRQEALQKSRGQPEPFMSPDDQMMADTAGQRAEQNLKNARERLTAFNQSLEAVDRPGGMKKEDVLSEYFSSGKYAEDLDLFNQAEKEANIQKLESAGPKFMGSVFPQFEKGRQEDLANLRSVINPAFNIPGMRELTGGYLYGFAGGGIAGLSGGIDKGPQRTSMNPDSQGLSGLLKNGMKI